MELDEMTLRDGLKFIVGTWRVDYIVNGLSNDLAHIPASEFKSDDGRDFSAICFEFFEDHSVVMTDGSKEEKGSWEQTNLLDYRCSFDAFLQIPEGDFKKNAETFSVVDGHLVFSIGFLAVAMKKVAEGVVTKAPDAGDLKGDPDAKEIVGKYYVYKAMTLVGGDFGLHTKEEVVASGEADEDTLKAFDCVVEMTDDHKVIEWMKLPEGLGEDDVKAALEAGEIKAVKDGYFTMGEKEWKAADGVYYYNTGEHRELFGEEQSPWDKLEFDADGTLPFGGMMVLKRI